MTKESKVFGTVGEGIRTATFGNGERTATYPVDDYEAECEAWAYVGGRTVEEVKATKEKVRKELDEIQASIPACLRNLMWVDGEMYYVDDKGNRTDREVDQVEVSKAMVEQMRSVAPKTPLKVNGVEVDREEMLRDAIKGTKV